MSSFKPAFPLSSFTFIKRLFSSISLSAIRVLSSAYLRLLIFLPAILISILIPYKYQFSSVTQSCLTLCDHMNCSMPGLPIPSPTPGVYPNKCSSSRGCHPAISSSVVPFSSCSQSLSASGSFPMS